MAVLNQLCVAESSTKTLALPPVRRLDLAQNFSFSPAHYFFNGLAWTARTSPEFSAASVQCLSSPAVLGSVFLDVRCRFPASSRPALGQTWQAWIALAYEHSESSVLGSR